MIEKDKWMSIGEIVAPQGLRGDIRIKPSSDFPERFTKPGKRWIQKANELPTEIKLKKGTLIPGKSIYVLSIEGVSDRTSAEEIIGWKLVIPVGTFDGIHLGHQDIINKLQEISKIKKLKSIVLSFFPHPKIVLQNSSDIMLINSLDEKTDK